MSARRLAVYAAPEPGSWLAERADAWLDEAPGLTGIDDLTDTARHYGVHGTLKPPFALAPGTDRSAALAAVEQLAGDLAPVDVGPLEVAALGRFLALRPVGAPDGLDHVAARCVRDLDHLRLPPMPDDLARRRGAGLTARQDELLERWGYPYVFDEFRFHMTLTRSLDPVDLDRVTRRAVEWFDGLASRPFVLDALWVFEQSERSSPFGPVARFPLLGPAGPR